MTRSLLLGSVLIVALSACYTVRVQESQFLDPRPAHLPDSVKASSYWPAPYRLEEGTFPFGDSARLYRVMLVRPGAELAVVYFGGSNFQIGQDYRRFSPLAELGVHVFVADYPGYGESGGTASIESFQQAALAVYDEALARTGVAASQLIVHGHSLGSMLAMYVASQRTVGAVVLEGPATNAGEWARTFTPWYARPFVRYDIPESLLRHDNLERVRHLRVPLLILAGEADRDTKPVMARRLYQNAGMHAAEKTLVVLSGTDHLILRRDPRAVEAYRSFVTLLAAAKAFR